MQQQAPTEFENVSKIDGDWFREENLEWEGYSQSYQIEKILFHEKSPYQDVLVFTSKSFGNVLVLDGVVQCTERDEFTYQEMITHIPMNLHRNPQKVLVIGGGDGGVVREVLKYSSVKEVVLCEIDQVVIEVCKKYLPTMSSSLSDPRVKVEVRDGKDFIRNHRAEFDVIITDSPDPEGEAKGLFEKNYYSELKAALTKDGVAGFQGEVMFLFMDFVRDMIKKCKEVFPNVGYAIGHTPAYTSGLTGYMVASANTKIDFREPVRVLSDHDLDEMKLRYYSTDVHRCAFALPTYARKALKKSINT